MPTADVPAIVCSEQFAWDCQVALLIVYGPTARCPHGESSGQPWAESPAGYRGLFQLGRAESWRFADWQDAFDAEANTEAAYQMWQERGWQPWDCKPEWVA